VIIRHWIEGLFHQKILRPWDGCGEHLQKIHYNSPQNDVALFSNKDMVVLPTRIVIVLKC